MDIEGQIILIKNKMKIVFRFNFVGKNVLKRVDKFKQKSRLHLKLRRIHIRGF